MPNGLSTSLLEVTAEAGELANRSEVLKRTALEEWRGKLDRNV